MMVIAGDRYVFELNNPIQPLKQVFDGKNTYSSGYEMPPMTSLGNMVGYGREYLTRAPWILLTPSVVIVLTTLAVSLLGDWLRDRLDPTLR